MATNTFENLEVWQLGCQLAADVNVVTSGVTRDTLTGQMQHTADSIPSNIAEGWKREGRRAAYQNHISIAMGSHAELETQLEICFRNRFLDPSTTVGTINLLNRAGQLLERLHDSLY